MTEKKITESLGSNKIEQMSINSEVDIDRIVSIYKKNLDFFLNKHNISNDKFAVELFDELKNGNIKFPINKHIEIYILRNKKNLVKIFKYLIFRYKFYLAGKKKINLGYPPYLLIEPVSSCNLRCPFCFQTDLTFTRKPFMGIIDFEFYKKIIDEADKLNVGAITLASRGEPTLHKKLPDMIEYVGKKENIFEKKLNTNATFLTENLCHSIFKNEFNQLVVSADHYEKDEFEKLRKNANFEQVVSNVDRMYSIREKDYPNSITEIRVSGIDSSKKLDREKFYNFWIKRADQVSAGYPMERWDTYNNKIHEDINDPCEQLWDRMYIWFDGKVNPCDADYKSYLSFGNVKENSIENIWNNKMINDLRESHLQNNRIKIDPCNKCGACFIN